MSTSWSVAPRFDQLVVEGRMQQKAEREKMKNVVKTGMVFRRPDDYEGSSGAHDEFLTAKIKYSYGSWSVMENNAVWSLENPKSWVPVTGDKLKDDPGRSLTVKELVERMDPRLRGRAIMVMTDNTVLVMDHGNWFTLNEDFSIKIDLAPVSEPKLGHLLENIEYTRDGWSNK